MQSSKDQLVFKTCLLLVHHFRNLMDAGNVGFHSRLFNFVLHPEYDFVGIGSSPEALVETDHYPEHVVPCAKLIEETKRLISEKNLADEEIAKLLQKHWKIARITKAQARALDLKGNHKSTMPKGWNFESGNTMQRLDDAGIKIVAS